MTFLKLSIPVYKKDKWQQLEKDGKIEVSSDVDNLSEGYTALKAQIDTLLVELDAQNRLANSIDRLEDEVREKTRQLEALKRNIETASGHYKNLELFLIRLGIDPSARDLTFDPEISLNLSSSRVSSVDIEVVSNPHEFE